MKDHLKFSGRCLLFIIAACLMLSGINRILRIKSKEGNYYSAPGQYDGFYHLEKNTTDVLLIGSSHMFYNICPQELYDRYGLRSYNLGMPGQNLVCTYYILEEALKYQNPETVVLETLYFFNDTSEIRNEGAHRKTIAWMRWSPLKVKAILDVCKATPELEEKSFFLENIIFHNRWSELSRADFDFSYYRTHTENKGYLPAMVSNCTDHLNVYEDNPSDEHRPMNDLEKDYAGRIADLCKEKGIQLVLCTTPYLYWGPREHQGARDFAKEHDLPYYNFNETSGYQLLKDFDYTKDNIDNLGHCNITGAKKLSDALGKILTEDLGMKGHTDPQWEDTKAYYAKLQEEDRIRFITDLPAYLKAIARPEYTVFFSVSDEASVSLSDKAVKAMRDLGLKAEIGIQESYLAVIDKGQVIYEDVGDRLLTYQGTLEDGNIFYEVESAGWNQGSYSHIRINDMHDRADYSLGRRGINIVVYDSYDNAVIDSVVFDTWDAGMPCYR